MAQQWSSTGEHVSAASSDPPTPSTPENMFRMKRAHRPEMWDFIRLVRKEEFAGVSKYDLISDNAKSAHCLKCNRDIPYHKGTTKYVKTHMETRHPGHVFSARQSQRASSSLQVTTHLTSEPMPHQSSIAVERLYDPESDPTIPRTPENMFRMKGAHKPELWDFIRLVRKDEYAHIPHENLISDNAVCAHCLKCDTNIPYSKGNTNKIKNHMAVRHPGHLSAERPSLRLTASILHTPRTMISRQTQVIAAEQSPADDERMSEPESDLSIPVTPGNMFKMKRAHKPELWDFVRLVRKDEFAGVSKDELISENAKSAHCLKCGTDIPYNKGLTNYVKSHMATRHSSHLNAAQARKKKHKSGVSLAPRRRPSTAPPSNRPPLVAPVIHVPEVIEISLSSDRPEAKAISPTLQAHANTLLAMWLAQSRRPFSAVEDLNLVAYVKHVSEAFGGVTVELPTQVKLRTIVMDIDQAPAAHSPAPQTLSDPFNDSSLMINYQ